MTRVKAGWRPKVRGQDPPANSGKAGRSRRRSTSLQRQPLPSLRSPDLAHSSTSGLTVTPEAWRQLVLRMYWDDEKIPSVEVPVGDFFANGWCQRCNVTSLPIAVNPAGGFNSYWEMPFRKRACITVENLSPDPINGFYYQIDYTLTDVPNDRAYFHAQWRRSNPLPYGEVAYPARRRTGAGTLRRYLFSLGGQQPGLVG